MGLPTKILLVPLLIFAAALALAQNGPFKHIIIIVQENRTPDNLFGAGHGIGICNTPNPFEPGVDIVDGGYGYYVDTSGHERLGLICNMPLPLSGWDAAIGDSVDPDHGYGAWTQDKTGKYIPPTGGWGLDYDGGNMDWFCHVYPPSQDWLGTCPPYSYVTRTTEVQAYFDIASTYGFANYMFQSSKGPSMPAHQFLFAGTSAPVAPDSLGGKCVAGNKNQPQFLCRDDYIQTNDVVYPVGCVDNTDIFRWDQPDGTLLNSPPLSGECYAHDSLVTDVNDCTNSNDGTDYCDRQFGNLQNAWMRWGYYVEPQGKNQQPEGYSVWDAPAFIPEVCYGEDDTNNQGTYCGGGAKNPASTEWSDHVRIPQGPIPYKVPYIYSWAPIFDDISNCKLPAIGWVIPDQSYSDHPGSGGANATAIGPSWVGDIVDAIGQSSLNPCGIDYWAGEPTAIFVVWDDWGGWFDHVKPPQQLVRIDQKPAPAGYTLCDPTQDQWGCGYTDGFRVPFLVVSEYTGLYPNGQYTNYVSGACGTGEPNQCPYFGPPGNPLQYVHDFGSILRYAEWNFGLPLIASLYDNWEYADVNAPDGQNGNVPLSDFFQIYTGPGSTGRPFTYITTQHPSTCFMWHEDTGDGCPLANSNWQPTEPDSY